MKALHLVLASLVAWALLVLPAYAETRLRLALEAPATSPLGEAATAFAEAVADVTAGAVTVEVLADGAAHRDREIASAVGSGALDIGLTALARYEAQVPETGALSLPFLFADDATRAAALAPDAPARRTIEAALGRAGTHVLWWQSAAPRVVVSTDGPVTTPGDLDGATVRVQGGPFTTWLDAVGAMPLRIPGSEEALAYERGVVTIGATSLDNVADRNLGGHLSHLTVTRHASIEYVAVISTRVWEALDEEVRARISAAATDVERRMRTRRASLNEERLAEARRNGLSVRLLTTAERAAWRAATASADAAFLKQAGPAGAELLMQIRDR